MTACGERRQLFHAVPCIVIHMSVLLTYSSSFLRFSLNLAPFGVKVACIEPGFFKTNVTDNVMVKNNLKRLWDRLPQDVKDDYGHSFFEQSELLHLC